MTLPETSNPFKNGRIVGTSVLPSAYHAANCKRGDPAYVMSRSSLMDFAACPAKWLAGWTRKDTDATRFGSLLDCRVLMPQTFNDNYAIEPPTYPAPKTATAVKEGLVKEGDPIAWNSTATFCKQWAKANVRGRIAISADERRDVEAARERLLADDRIRALVSHCQTQVWAEAGYTDKATGLAIRVKTLIDLAPEAESPFRNALADFKTARDASPRPFTKQIFEHHYDAQAANSLWIWEAATGEPRSEFLHVIQENTPPWMPARRLLSAEFLAIGQMKIKSALELYCQCLKENRWPDWDDNSPYSGWGMCEPEHWMIGHIA